MVRRKQPDDSGLREVTWTMKVMNALKVRVLVSKYQGQKLVETLQIASPKQECGNIGTESFIHATMKGDNMLLGT